jgi:nucleoside-diphosphate-sugar epimerase
VLSMIVGASCPLGAEIYNRLPEGSVVKIGRTYGVDLTRQDIPLLDLEGVDTVFWLAQHPGYNNPEEGHELPRVNIPRLPRRVKRIILASTGSLDGCVNTPYAASKAAAEAVLPALADAWCSVRIYSMWGQPKGVVHQVRQRVAKGEPVTSGGTILTPVHLEDVAEAMVRLAGEARLPAVVRAAGPRVTIRQIARAADPSALVGGAVAVLPFDSKEGGDLLALGIAPRRVL